MEKLARSLGLTTFSNSGPAMHSDKDKASLDAMSLREGYLSEWKAMTQTRMLVSLGHGLAPLGSGFSLSAASVGMVPSNLMLTWRCFPIARHVVPEDYPPL